jgi:serine phosphatase RsbU (regulator of sigma subunit)
MADSKITKKYSVSGSLTRRILLIPIFLLVIPLFLQTYFLYNQEYKQKLEEVKTDLTILAEERARLIAKNIQLDWQFLEQGGDRRVQKIPLPKNMPNHFVLISQNQDTLLVGVVDPPQNALVLPIPLTEIAKDLPRTYLIRLSFLDQAGNRVWENRTFLGKSDLISVREPIGGTSLSLQLDVEKNHIQGLQLQSYYFRLATFVFFVGFLGGGALFFFTRRVGRPLKHLGQTMQRVSEGALHARYSADWMGFEINTLGLQFNATLDALLQSMQEVEKEREVRQRLAEELRIGHDIQASLLPSHVSLIPGVNLASFYAAAKEVNGDFYDFFALPNGQILISICDTAGKGISACLYSLGLRSILRALASVSVDLSDLVRKANDLYLSDAHASSMFATAWLGLYDPKKKKLTYCSQGHPPAILARGNEIEELSTEGIAFGAQKVDLVATQEVQLQAGDLLILYTDGITEAHDVDAKLFGKERLFEIILQKSHRSAEAAKEEIIQSVHHFSQRAPQHDDITLVVLQIGDATRNS